MDGSHARGQELVLDAFMVSGVVVVEELEGFGTVAVVELLAGLEPFGVVGQAGAIGYRGSEAECGWSARAEREGRIYDVDG